MIQVTAQDCAVALSKASLFLGLAPEDFTQLLAQGSIERFEPGQIIYAPGDEAPCGFVLIDGRVEMAEGPYPGRRLGSQLFSAGALFSEGGFIRPWKHKRQCTAIEETIALSLTPEALRSRLEASDSAAVRIIDALLDLFVRDLRDANGRLDEIHSRPDRTLRQLRALMVEGE